MDAKLYKSEEPTKDFYSVGPVYCISKVKDILLTGVEFCKETISFEEQGCERQGLKKKWKNMKRLSDEKN